MTTFAVKNFEKFQHYKDRSPPWIRLYNSVLDDYEFGRLPDASKAHLLAIWLLASRYENKIPYDAEWVSRRINATDEVDLAALEEAGFIVVEQGCSEALAPRKQVDAPEESRDRAETETSSLRSDVSRDKRAKAVRIPADFAPDLEEAQRIGLTPAEARTEAATFVDYWTAKGAGGAKLDWPATWRVWCRNTIKRRPTGPPSRQQRAVNGYAALALEMAANEPDRPNRPDQASGPGHRPQQGDAYPRLLDAEQPRRAG